MHILLTRPMEDSKELILKFSSMKHKVSHLPLLQIKKKEIEDPIFEQFKAIIFTSANAIKNLDTSKIDKNIICFCVGNATERKAKELGFQNIFCAEGNVNNLKELILQNFNPKTGSMLYVSGEIVSYDLDKDLISENYIVKRVKNYTAIPNENLDDNFLINIKSSVPDVVFIYSENSARTFYKMIKKHNLDSIWMETNLMCMGEKASSALNDIKWKKIFLFNSGEEEFLLYKI
ncbi:uroporphyrinogen III synthase [Pelagibacteraceae bacterium GOM-A5]|nr:uroporphyrinogen III synthase [Pelagibacteraceae bacterium GOM-A5]